MNLILFEPAEISAPLPRSDPRGVHLLEVLRRTPGDTFDAGLVNGPYGKGAVVSVGEDALVLRFVWGERPPPLSPITLVLGLPRPQTSRTILREATALGVSAMHFVATDKGEWSYARSTLWTASEWRRCLIAGAQQAFSTRLPAVTVGQTLPEVIAALPADACLLALDNHEAAPSLGAAVVTPPIVLALGAERGWSDRERALLRSHHFLGVHLGRRALRAETACVAAVSLVQAKLGLM